MSYVVNLVTLDLGMVRELRTFGPYGSEEKAEHARRRVHLEYAAGQAGWLAGQRLTFVSKVEAPK